MRINQNISSYMQLGPVCLIPLQ